MSTLNVLGGSAHGCVHRDACGVAEEIEQRFSLSFLGQLQSDWPVVEKEACIEIIFQVNKKCRRAFFDFEKVFALLKFLILLAAASSSSFLKCYAWCRGLENLTGKLSRGTQGYAQFSYRLLHGLQFWGLPILAGEYGLHRHRGKRRIQVCRDRRVDRLQCFGS